MAAAVALALVVAACGDDDDDASPTTSTTTTTAEVDEPTSSTTAAEAAGPANLDGIAVSLTEIARLEQPIDLAVREGFDGLFLAEKGGRVRYLPAPGAETEQVLDISDDVSTGNEQGLLGITFSPKGEHLYVHYTNRDGDTRVDELAMGDAATAVDLGTRRTVLEAEQPYANHNGGRLTFGPDGLLYLGLGDGGAGGDPEHNGQDPDALLGKILRFDPAGGEPERWAIGLRNPWRFSFDRETGDVWVGDVGQNAWEEIDLIAAGTPAGVNLGWNRFEGTHRYDGNNDRTGLLFPVYEYGRDDGQSVVGGFVYRGDRPEWNGVYFFADTYTAVLQVLLNTGTEVLHRDLGVEVPGGLISSFGEDADGELYVLSLDGGVFRLDP
ncbi:MAG TPA: PQQ-dependent sugar dehydrogenase [Acidimicrobiales bacterium]|nr:PQQ-dependent sugar dehydrogenase [Acidimicrobiales bacterium]